MKEISKKHKDSNIVKRANYLINNSFGFEEEMMVFNEGIKEYDNCYALTWCKKSEEHLFVHERTLWGGTGRLLISKDGEFTEFEGSDPGVDWIHHFENKLQNLEDYWSLEIRYSEDVISKLKSILKCSTAELLKMVDKDQRIILTESKAWNDENSELETIASDIKNAGVSYELSIKSRKKALE